MYHGMRVAVNGPCIYDTHVPVAGRRIYGTHVPVDGPVSTVRMFQWMVHVSMVHMFQ